MEVEEDGFLPMPSIELNWDEETTHMEGWIQAAQLEAVDGVKRVPTWTANGLHILPYTVEDGHIIVGGDVDFGSISLLEASKTDGKALNGVWFQDALIPYFMRGVTPKERVLVEEALDILGNHSPIRFELVSLDYQGAALEFLGNVSCDSSAGKVIHDRDANGFVRVRAELCSAELPELEGILHQLGHVVGLHHEFQRADRDDFVSLCSDDASVLFTKIEGVFWGQKPHEAAPYDSHSIMNRGYRSCILPIGEEQSSSASYLGRPQELSLRDINRLYRMYGQPISYASQNQQFGINVAHGDFDDDGIADLAILSNEPESESFNQLNLQFLKGVEKDPRQQGSGVSFVPWFKETLGYTQNADMVPSIAVGDFNGDGIPDLAVGDPSYDDFRGRVRLITLNTHDRFGDRAPWGAKGFESAEWIYPEHVGLMGEGPMDFGRSISAAQLDDDPALELLIGAPSASPVSPKDLHGVNGLPVRGAVAAVQPDEAHKAVLIWNPLGTGNPSAIHEFGAQVTRLPGFCQEGTQDSFAIGAPALQKRTGAVYTYGCPTEESNPLGSRPMIRDWTGEAQKTEFGAALTAFSISNPEDGTMTTYLLIGAPESSSHFTPETGAVWLREISPDGIWKEVASFVPTDTVAGANFGEAVAVSSNQVYTHKDQVMLAAGAPGAMNGNVQSGKVYQWNPWVLGEVSNLATVHTPQISTPGARYGASLSSFESPGIPSGFAVGSPGARIPTGMEILEDSFSILEENTGAVEVILLPEGKVENTVSILPDQYGDLAPGQ
jgi:hypothetical protein